MKRIVCFALSLAMLLSCAMLLSGCAAKDGGSGNSGAGISAAASLADLKGAKIAAQTGTFHADALTQIEEVQSSTYPEFADLLTALKSGAIDGYIAEEPTALSVCLEDETLTYIALKNNDTGFTATDADVGIAVGCATGSELVAQINEVIASISEDTRAALMEQMVKLSAGEEIDALALVSEAPASPAGVLRVGMECAYAPYNWTETEALTPGAVAISGEGKEGLYANGYDVQVAQYIANMLGMSLEIYALEWDSLVPAVQSGTVDAIIAGMSPTAEREEEIDFTDVYYESNLVVITRKDA
jgi:ABC-type amino acid transport substrate-binding protein